MSELNCELLEAYHQKYGCYDEFRIKMEQLITEIIKRSGIKINSITSRCKTFESLGDKISRKNNIYKTLEDITDLVGLRIITYYSDDVDKVAQIIKDQFYIDEENSIDKRAKLDVDKFGYLSLHIIICLNDSRRSLPEYQDYCDLKVEIQIRSLLQHAWSEIEHDSGYKGGNEIPREIKRDFYRLAGLLELADKEFISIREGLIEYSDKVSRIIETKPNEVMIDAVSLLRFINTNLPLQAINQTIVGFCNLEIDQSSEIQITNTVNELTYIGLKTIEDVNFYLSKYRDDILAYAKKILLGKNEESLETKTLSDVIGLFYLSFIIIGVKFSNEQIVEYLNKMSIGLEDRVEFASEIKTFCEERKLI